VADPDSLPTSEIEHARDVGAVTYLGAYLRLMLRALGVPTPDNDEFNVMLLEMVEPMNHATQVIWCALMEDVNGAERALKEFKDSLPHIVI
jgi:hypothetical protein